MESTAGSSASVAASAGFHAAWEGCEPNLLRQASRLSQSPELARDLMHDTFLRCSRYWPPGVRGNLCGWFYRALVSQFLDLKRREKRHQTVELPAELPGPGGPASINVLALRACLEKLARANPRRFAILTLYYLEGWQQQEIADHLHLSESYVKKEVHRALEFLRGCWKGAL